MAIIEKGKLIYSGSVEGFAEKNRGQVTVWVRVASDPSRAMASLRVRPEVISAEEEEDRIRLTLAPDSQDISFVAETLVGSGAKLVELRRESLDLEEMFLRVTQGETQ